MVHLLVRGTHLQGLDNLVNDGATKHAVSIQKLFHHMTHCNITSAEGYRLRRPLQLQHTSARLLLCLLLYCRGQRQRVSTSNEGLDSLNVFESFIQAFNKVQHILGPNK
jgi:hypothetical protein